MSILTLLDNKSPQEIGEMFQTTLDDFIKEKIQEAINDLLQGEIEDFLTDALRELTFDIRNGYYKRHLKTNYDSIEVKVPRDRLNLFMKGKLLGFSGVVWNDDLDLEGDTIYSDGVTVINSEPIENILLGFEFKQERIKQGLSQQDLSMLSGIDQGGVSKIEKGIANPTMNTIIKLSKCLNKKISISLG